MSFRMFAVVAVAVIAPLGFSQGRGGSPPATGGGAGGASNGTTTPGTTTTLPGNSIPVNPNPSTTTTTGGIPQTIPISGKVQLEDGTAPGETVVIERVCNGSPRAEGY